MQTHGSRPPSNKNNSNLSINCNNNNNLNSSSSSSGGPGPTSKPKKSQNLTNSTALETVAVANFKDTRRGEDDNLSPKSVMPNIQFSPIDDDHIDDQESMKLGNILIQFEDDFEKDKIGSEQQANNKVSVNKTNSSCTTTTNNAPSSSSSSFQFDASASSSTTNSGANGNNGCPSTSTNSSGVKSNQKSSGKVSISSTSNSNSGSTNNNSNNSSISINNNNNATNNNNGHANTKLVFKSSADERCELKMRITRETKPGKSEHKIVTSPNQKSPTSCSGNNIINDNLNFDEENSRESNSNSKPTQSSSSISSTKECGTSTSIGTITEPECLGPCEPGTSVTLEGIVWQETEGGILVVNVTWRGKTYVGALLDCTKHDWAPPRLCDSPASDLDSKAHKGVRTKRIVTRSNGVAVGMDEKKILQTTGKLRNGKGRRILPTNDPVLCNKRQRDSDKPIENSAAQVDTKSSNISVSSMTNSDNACVPMNVDTSPATNTNSDSITTTETLADKTGPNSPIMIGCTEQNCSKKFRNMNGLLYHTAHAHSNDSNTNSTPIASTNDEDMKPLETSIITSNNNESITTTETLTEKSGPSSPIMISCKEPNCSKKFRNMTGLKDHTTRAHNHENNNPPHQPLASLSSSSPPHRQPQLPVTIDEGSKHSANPNIPAKAISETSSSNNETSHEKTGSNSPIMISCKEPNCSKKFRNNNSLSDHLAHAHNNDSTNNLPPLPPTNEEGMKPSGTSTGPPPAPHQTNCFFNPPFMAGGGYNPFGLNPYLPRPPSLPMYDPIAPPTSNANANAVLLRFMNQMRVPPLPETPSRLPSPSMSKNMGPFSPMPIPVPVPTTQLTNLPMPNMPPMTSQSPMSMSSPHLRMASQVDRLMPPNAQVPFPPPPPTGLNPGLGLPGSMNPLGPLGPPVQSLLDEQMAKQFPRRFT